VSQPYRGRALSVEVWSATNLPRGRESIVRSPHANPATSSSGGAPTRRPPSLCAPLTDLLLVIYRRRPVHGEGIDIPGDEQLLDFWLERVNVG
jgi:hypothetical protein